MSKTHQNTFGAVKRSPRLPRRNGRVNRKTWRKTKGERKGGEERKEEGLANSHYF